MRESDWIFKFLFISILAFSLFFKTPMCLAETSISDLPCRYSKEALKVSFLNVGQGEAILITCPDRITQVLLDAGESTKRYPEGTELFLSSLRSEMGSDKVLEFAVNTHAHPDHISGFAALTEENNKHGFSIISYIDDGGNYPESLVEERLRSRLKKLGINYTDAVSSRISTLDICASASASSASSHDKVQFAFLRLNDEQRRLLACPINLNDCSLVSRMEYQGVSFLFLADVTTKWETEVALKSETIRKMLPSNILKVGHHASHSTTAEFLKVVKPNVAVLSTGAPGLGTTSRFGFPQAEVIDRLNGFFFRQYGTASKGHRMINACNMVERSCVWKKGPLHPAIRSTASSGTVRVFARRGEICMESENEHSRFRVRW